MKLPALKGGASREGTSFDIVSLNPTLKGGLKENLPVRIRLSGISLQANRLGDLLHPFDRVINQFIQAHTQHLGSLFND